MSFDAAKALTRSIVLLSGDEEMLRRRALQELVAAATAEGDFDLQTFEAADTGPSEWLASASTAPFLNERRTVVVRHLLRREVDEVPSGGLGSVPPSALLILVADEESGGEDKQRRLAALRKQWEKAVGSAGGAVELFATKPQDLKQAIRKEAERLGKRMSPAAVESLAEITGASLSRSIEELDKLALYVGSEEHIREADIRAVVVPSREWNVYKLVDAVIEGAVSEALRQLRILVGSQTKATDAAFSRILPTLSRHFRLLWQARLCFEAGCSPEDPPEAVRKLFPGKPNLCSEQPYRQAALMRKARLANLPALSRCMQAVSDADVELKGQGDGFSPIDTLEQMVLSMVEALAADRGAARPAAR